MILKFDTQSADIELNEMVSEQFTGKSNCKIHHVDMSLIASKSCMNGKEFLPSKLNTI